MAETLVRLRGVTKDYPVTGSPLGRKGGVGVVRALAGVNLEVHRGETLGIVGESGCGKTTLGRILVRLLEPTSGSVEFDGHDVTHLRNRQLKWLRRRAQIVFQDPYASLDPRSRIGATMAESLKLHGIGSRDEIQERVSEMLEMVGLHRSHVSRYPHEFSGGQRQRVGIGRALILRPDFVVADEPVSALDVSVQAQILNLLKDLQQELELTLVFVAHNLAVVEHISDRVVVMYLGRVVELTDRDRLFKDPSHPYTETLMASIPQPDPRRRRSNRIAMGEIPSPLNPPSGCTFHPRCPLAEQGLCDVTIPTLRQLPGITTAHQVACHVRTRAGQGRPQ